MTPLSREETDKKEPRSQAYLARILSILTLRDFLAHLPLLSFNQHMTVMSSVNLQGTRFFSF